MSPERWSFVPLMFALLLLTAGVATGHQLMVLVDGGDWSLLVRAELELYGGLWLLWGLFPGRTRILALIVCTVFFLGDLGRAVTGVHPRYVLGRIELAPWWLLGTDLATIVALHRWRPAAVPRPWIDSHLRCAAGATVVAAILGVAVNLSQIGYFPIIATASSVESSSSPGLDYLVYTPDGYYRSLSSWPLLLVLHGAGAVDRNIDRVRRDGLPRRIEEGGTVPFVVVAPQSRGGGWDVNALDALLDEVLRRYRVDADRVYLTGLSMGGYGTWAMAAAHPERFAAIAPICGGGDPAWAERLRRVPIWAFHGDEDTVIPPDESRKMIAAVERAGGEAKLTIYPQVGHDAWTRAFSDPRLYTWLLEHRRSRAGRASARPDR
jgi:poly(3-hydroxybutyrate) depolymerase